MSISYLDFPLVADAGNFPLPAEARTARASSSFAQVCDLLRIGDAVASRTDPQQFAHLRVRTGQRVHIIGQACDRLFIVNSGFLKAELLDEAGNLNVIDFPMRGDLIGVDGIASQRYTIEVTALTDCDLTVLPLAVLTRLGRAHLDLEDAMCGVMCRSLVREQAMIGMRGALSAQARMARFLLRLSERYACNGYSGTSFMLRMARADISSYLGMALETVSRSISALDACGVITVTRRTITINDLEALRTLRRVPRVARSPRLPSNCH